MRGRFLTYIGAVAVFVFAGSLLAAHLGYSDEKTLSPYVEQLGSSVRGLSPQEVDDLANGRGAGYARTAELNSYPGPRHLLDMKQELGLSSGQVTQIEAIIAKMQPEAKRIGQEILRREMQLSAAFANGTISETDLKALVENLAVLYGDFRVTHLQAHLQVKPLLSEEKIAKYNALRGYTSSSEMPMEHPYPMH